MKPNKSDKVVAVAGGEKDSETKPSIGHRRFDAISPDVPLRRNDTQLNETLSGVVTGCQRRLRSGNLEFFIGWGSGFKAVLSKQNAM